MSVYTFPYTCEFCGSRTEMLASGSPVEANTRATAVVKCQNRGCNREYQLIVVARPISGRDVYA